MEYGYIDTILEPWAKVHGLMILTQYRDEEVRHVRILGSGGDIFGIKM